MPPQIESLNRDLVELKKSLYAIKDVHLDSVKNMFNEVQGCTDCRGRGWVVTWDTLDSMSGGYHESASCKTCNGAGRLTDGERVLYPENNKYDNFHHGSYWIPEYDDATIAKIDAIHTSMGIINSRIDEENSKWSVDKDKVVSVVVAGKGPKSHRTELGIIGYVLRIFTNDWGTKKAIILDEYGKKHWPNASQLEVIDPDASDEKWEKALENLRAIEGLPIIGTVKAKSAKASLVVTTTRKEKWIPFSMVPELKSIRKGETGSFNVPIWFASKNELM